MVDSKIRAIEFINLIKAKRLRFIIVYFKILLIKLN